MGTSSIYEGKKDRNPLLPDDYQEDQNDVKPSKPVKWEDVKSNMSKYINSGGQRGSVKHITKQYIRASGGSRQMSSKSSSGIRAGANLGAFFSGLKSQGFIDTFNKLGIEFTGRSIQEVFSHLVEVLAPASNTKEDIASKEALKEALSKVYDFVEVNNMNIECIDKMPDELMTEALCEYVSSYIWALMLTDLESRFEKYSNDTKQTLLIEQEFKGYISSTVKVEFDTKGDILNKDITQSISELYTRCLSVLEGTL